MVMTYAGQPVRTALEIGAGTGKATRLLAQRGVTVTATEPDGAMLAELRKHVPATVKTVRAAFEDLRPGESYGLVYAAAALHWTNPQGRWSRMAALLEPGGVFASFGGPAQLADPAVQEAVRAARAPFLDSDEVPSPDGTPPGHDMQWPGTELRRPCVGPRLHSRPPAPTSSSPPRTGECRRCAPRSPPSHLLGALCSRQGAR